jgi:hypothetical protein
MRTAGIIILVLGIIGTLIFGIQALQESEAFSILGVEIGVSTANWTPVIISVILLIVGLVMMRSRKA